MGRISFVDYEVSDQLFEMSKAMISHGACDSILSCTFEKQIIKAWSVVTRSREDLIMTVKIIVSKQQGYRGK